MSPEREEYHRQILNLVVEHSTGGLLYDIGVSSTHDYKHMLSTAFTVKTIDRNKGRKPDICIDLEATGGRWTHPLAEFLLCNGVTETCGDPFALVRGLRDLIKVGGTALFGIMLLGYPLGTKADFTRFTPAGAVRLVEQAGFKVQSAVLVHRDSVPSYVYITAVAE